MKAEQARDEAERFCEENLAACCDELLEMQNTGVLRNGRVRELITLCRFAGPIAQSVAEAMVRTAALRAVARK